MFNFDSIDFQMGMLYARLEEQSSKGYLFKDFIDMVNSMYKEVGLRIQKEDIETLIELHTTDYEVEEDCIKVDGEEFYVYLKNGMFIKKWYVLDK